MIDKSYGIFHVHTYRCGHAANIPDEEYIVKAISMLAKDIWFTDHSPFPGDPFGNRMKYSQLEEYIDTLSKLKNKYKDVISVHIGLEIEYFPSFDDYYKDLFHDKRLEILLLGQHMYELDDGMYNFDLLPKQRMSLEMEGITNALIQGMNTGYFSICAHPDRTFRYQNVWDNKSIQCAKRIIKAAYKNNVVLAGGLGTRLSEVTDFLPKPMIEIGGKPILWHIMKIYSFYGFNDFVILTGYKSHIIKDYFVHYYQQYSDITVDMATNTVEIHRMQTEPWKVTMLYTGPDTLTGTRIKKAQDYIGNESFMLTYGDGVGNIDIRKLLKSHKNSQKMCTITAVRPMGRFGALDISKEGLITTFKEKPEGENSWINGGFMVCEPNVFDYIPNNKDIMFEKEPLEKIANEGQLNSYKHDGFWRPMDTLKDKNELTQMWKTGTAPWAIW